MKVKKYVLGLVLLLPTSLLNAQQPVGLTDCRQWAREVHPLLTQKELYRQLAELKIDNVQASWFPQVDLNAQATYQSDVTNLGLSLPGVTIPRISKDQYKAYLDLKHAIWDGGIAKARKEIERTQEASNQQEVEVELYEVNEQVNQLFFSSFYLQQNLYLLEKKQQTLESRKHQMQSAFSHGALLASELDQVLAELIKVKQQQVELQTSRTSALAALAILTGKEIGDLEKLELEISEQSLNDSIKRPEMNLFAQQQSVLAASSDLAQKGRNPKFFGFGQAGYGRPALNMLNNDFDTFYLVGLGMSWTILDWKQTKRDREAIQLQQELVQTKQVQFERSVEIALDRERRIVAQTKALMAQDEELIAVQERITKSSAAKLENGAYTAADYLQDLNAELAARINFELHKVQLEAAKVAYQTILGQQ